MGKSVSESVLIKVGQQMETPFSYYQSDHFNSQSVRSLGEYAQNWAYTFYAHFYMKHQITHVQ